MSLITSVVTAAARGLGLRASANWPGRYTIDDIAGMYKLGDIIPNFTLQPFRENVAGDFMGLVDGAYRGNAIVFACELVRFSLFSEARFQYQRMSKGRPGDLFGDASLGILEKPEPGKTTGDLLSRAILDADLSGSWYGVRRGDRIKRLRPDWVSILMGSPNRAVDLPAWDPDIEVIGYAYWPGGYYSGADPVAFGVDEVAHFAPVPDPLASYRGMSWLTPVIRELKADSSATQHKLSFFENAATPNLVVKFDPAIGEQKVREFIEIFEQDHSGTLNAYRTAYLAGGADITVVGANLEQMDFKSVQGAGETRIAAAAAIHPTIVGLSEGLAGSSLNAGNFGAARRLTGDKFLRPAWRNMAGSLEMIVPPPAGSRLWYDSRDVAFLREDVTDAAKVLDLEMSAISKGVTSGFVPDTAVDAVTSGDLRRLRHGGYLTVQAQPLRIGDDAETEEPRQVAASPVAGLLASGEGGVRCPSCDKKVARALGPGSEMSCPRCKAAIVA